MNLRGVEGRMKVNVIKIYCMKFSNNENISNKCIQKQTKLTNIYHFSRVKM